MNFVGLNWSALLVFLALGLIGIWVCYSFLNKKGLYLFSVLAVAVCFGAFPNTAVSVFSRPISIATVVMPVVYLAFLTCFNKHGKEETKKLFFAVLITMATLFVCKFFEAAYLDSEYKAQIFLSWDYLGKYVASVISFACASALTLFITTKINVKSLQNFLKLAIYLFIASVIDAIVYIVLVYTGSMSFGNMLLTLLITLVILATVCLLLGYFEKFFNRKPAPEKSVENKTEEKTDNNEETKNKSENNVEEENQKSTKKEDSKNLEENTKADDEIVTPEDID